MRYRNLPAHVRRELRDLSRPVLRSLTPVAVSSMSSISISRPALRRASAFLEPVQSGRMFHPLASYQPPRLVNGNPARIVAGRPARIPRAVGTPRRSSLRAALPRNESWSMPVGVRFSVPAKTVVCIRRKRRRSVIFALGHNGRSRRSRRLTPFSSVRC